LSGGKNEAGGGPEEQRALSDAQHLIDAIAADEGGDEAGRPQNE
jgi:hypothetical protein